MGKWKFVNYLMVVVILFHMYWYFTSRYEAAWPIYIMATIAWIIIASVGFYIFHFRLRRSLKMAKTDVKISKTPSKERPKVMLKRRKEDKDE